MTISKRLQLRVRRPVLMGAIVLAGAAAWPVHAQDAAGEARLRKLEAEVRALQRSVFPGTDGKYFPPQVSAAPTTAPVTGAPAATPVADLLVRMEAVEAQLARLTAASEENANKLSQLEARMAALAPAAVVPTTTPAPAAILPAPAPSVNIAPPPARPAVTAPSTTPAARPAAPSAQRLAAVRAVEKPATGDVPEDEYSYGFRLWEAKFYPEAQQQLKMYLDKYPRHTRVSYARNLLGRAFLDDAKPRDAAQWFLQNYQSGKTGDRAPDSLLFLSEAMRQLKDTSRACIALAEFTDNYPREATGRLKAQYDAARAAVKCN